MLSPVSSKRDISQWPVKTAPCGGDCGGVIEYQTKPKRYCGDCAEQNASQSPGAKAQRVFRQRQAAGLKGFLFSCAVCGESGTSKVPNRKWCEGCREEGVRRRDAVRSAAVGSVPFGSLISCKNCSAQIVKLSRAHVYCEPCGNLARKSKLPEYQEWSRDYMRRYAADRRRRDPAYAIRGRMTANINNSLREGKAGRSWERLLGYTLADLMIHLEKQFLPGMTWDNRSEWHIDHIRPLCSFEFQTPECPQFGEAWALNNLQPLWAIDNIRKGGRWEPPA